MRRALRVSGTKNCRLQDVQLSAVVRRAGRMIAGGSSSARTRAYVAVVGTQHRPNGRAAFRSLTSTCEGDAWRRCIQGMRRPPGSGRRRFPGGHRSRVTPVPIPNTEVKPATADGTARATSWESRSLPGLFFRGRRRVCVAGLFFCRQPGARSAADRHPRRPPPWRTPPVPRARTGGVRLAQPDAGTSKCPGIVRGQCIGCHLVRR